MALHGAPVYMFHEIVHNGHVVDELRRRGAVVVQAIEAIPRGAVTVFSAHGVSNAVIAHARSRALRVIDATCPLVAKVHAQAQRYVLLGHTLGCVDIQIAPRRGGQGHRARRATRPRLAAWARRTTRP